MFFHLGVTFLHVSSSRVANAAAFSSFVISRYTIVVCRCSCFLPVLLVTSGTDIKALTGPYAPLIGMAVGKAVGDKLDKMDAKRNSRNRKIKFFLDKMKAEGEQQDSFAKLVKDLFINKMALPLKKIMVAVGGFLLVLVLLIAVTVLPVVAVIAILYNSPFAFFLPPLESGDTVTTVTSAYVSEFNRDINTLANEHTGYDTGQIVYVDFEASCIL